MKVFLTKIELILGRDSMGGFKTHIAYGMIASVVTSIVLICCVQRFMYFTVEQVLVSSVVMVLFSLLPDIDIKSSASRLFYVVVFGLLLCLIYCERYVVAGVVGVLAVVPQLVVHRGFFHTVWAALILGVLLFVILVREGIGLEVGLLISVMAFIGYCVHLFIDYVSSRF